MGDLNCQIIGKIFAEISYQNYYDYIAHKIMEKVKVVSGYTMPNPFYVRLNINEYTKYPTLGNLNYPLNDSTFHGCSPDKDKNGMKITLDGSRTNIVHINLGCYDGGNQFNAILCLSSVNLTVPTTTTATSSTSTAISTTSTSTASATETSTSTTIQTTTMTGSTSETSSSTTDMSTSTQITTLPGTSSQASASTTTTSNNCSDVTDCVNEELCSVTFFINGTYLTEDFDCYELGNEKLL